MIGVPVKITRGAYRGAAGTIIRLLPGNPYPFEVEFHPTLKPISLTTWLARLIMPPAPGVILVPFAGAGSEMIGALKAGWSGVFGIEREEDYARIARARLAHWCPESEAA